MILDRLPELAAWKPPGSWHRVVSVEAHTAGEPLRVVVSGLPTTEGPTILARRRAMRAQHDQLRTALMWEPRGHADMYGCLIVPPERVDAHFGVLFTHNDGYSTMCGHGIIAVVTVAVQMGLVDVDPVSTEVRIDTPAGRVVATAHLDEVGERVARVSFRNVVSFVEELGASVEVDGIGRVTYDLSFGGAYYALVDAAQVGLRCTPDNAQQLTEVGRRIKHAISKARQIDHPEQADLGFLYGTIFTGPPGNPKNHSRNVCVFADGEVDRSPTGTGVSARAAIEVARGQLELGEAITIESILGTTFVVTPVGSGRCGDREGIVPLVTGSAFITGRMEHWLDPNDPLRHGFLLR